MGNEEFKREFTTTQERQLELLNRTYMKVVKKQEECEEEQDWSQEHEAQAQDEEPFNPVDIA